MKRTKNQRRLNVITTIAILTLFMVPFQNCGGKFDTQNQGLSISSTGGAASTTALFEKSAYGKSGLRRLTAAETVRSVGDIFGVSAATLASTLPNDNAATLYFNNEYGGQTIDAATVTGFHRFAEAYSVLVSARANIVNTLAGCTPANPNDKACFIQFAQKVGRRVLRRPVTTAEADTYATLLLPHAVSQNRFLTAVELLLQVWLQNPEFLYRFEFGVANQLNPNLKELTDYEIATRMSFLIWGSTPDEALLDAAEAGTLKDEAVRVVQAERMLASAKAKPQWESFHSQWLGYSDTIFPTGLEADFIGESNALINRVVFANNSDWLDIFRADETYVTPQLALHYGLPGVAQAAWVKYPPERGGGMLSHGSLVSLGAKFGDTSPTRRGYEFYKRLMCGQIPAVPGDIDVDVPPGLPTDCKIKSYSMRSISACATCHNITDNIGFGLENMGAFGEWRTTEPGKPSCTIVNDGIVDMVSFAGPRELGDRLTKNKKVSACAVKQLYRFFAGRDVTPEDADTVQALSAQYSRTPQLKTLITALVKSPAIMHRVEN